MKRTFELKEASPLTKDGKETLSGRDPEDLNGPAPAALDPATGMYKDYWVLPKEDRAKGFVRPYRDEYRHIKCGKSTSMGHYLSETYARDPKFYSHTFCTTCRTHPPVSEFVWVADGEEVGS